MHPDDESVSLPDPPPPRPSARDAAIEAAMRRFDGVADEPQAGVSRPRVAWSRRPQLQLSVAASLVLAVGLPATFIAIRDHHTVPGSPMTPRAEAPAQFDRSPSRDALAP